MDVEAIKASSNNNNRSSSKSNNSSNNNNNNQQQQQQQQQQEQEEEEEKDQQQQQQQQQQRPLTIKTIPASIKCLVDYTGHSMVKLLISSMMWIVLFLVTETGSGFVRRDTEHGQFLAKAQPATATATARLQEFETSRIATAKKKKKNNNNNKRYYHTTNSSNNKNNNRSA